jgi:hypothetical protein
MRKKEVIKLRVLPDDEAEAKILEYVIEHPWSVNKQRRL